MKSKYKFFCFILTACLIFPAYSTPMSDTDAFAEKVVQSCPHNTLYKFDENTKTLNGVFEGNRVEALLSDIAFVGDSAEVIWNEKTITEGDLQVGMIVKIHHDNLLYGEYTIEHLQESYPENPVSSVPTNAPMRAAANTYGFILPIDGMSLSQIPDYEYNRFNAGHRGVDIMSAYGTPIRAMASGTVVDHLEWNASMGKKGKNSWGNYVKIDHGNNYTTLYAHMNSAPSVELGQWVSQGQIIGYVGSSGNSSTNHLHLEVAYKGSLQNPIDYLTGAPSYSGGHTCTYEYTYYLTAHPHRQYGYCSTCKVERPTGEIKACPQTAIYPKGAHPHQRYRVYACGETEDLDSFGECSQVAIYPSGDHPHRRYRVYACGETEWLDSYGECHQVAIYPSGDHPHRRYRVYACDATEWLDSFGECNQVAIYPKGTHPHQRYRVYACGATEDLDSYGECHQVAIYPSGDHPHRRYRVYACDATEWLDSFGECNQVAIYPKGAHPHQRYRVYACGATEDLDSFGECPQVAIYPSGDHPHRRYRVYACGETEWLDSYGECTCK